jgi:hypothetical protein
MPPVATIRFTGGRLAGREVEHQVVSLAPREIRTRDAEGRVWCWLVPLGVCKDTPHAVLVDPEGAVAAAREAGLVVSAVAPRAEVVGRQGVMW